jgi:hypothetical protein
MKEMQHWLQNYERSRHSKQPKEPKESWISSKYDTQGHWQEVQQIWIPELQMNYGRAVSALRKSWTAYRIAGRNGEPRADLALRIVRIQSALGIEKSVFPELQGMEMDDEELSEEEIELRKEEKQENGGDWSFNFATTEEGSEYTEEWSEDKQIT